MKYHQSNDFDLPVTGSFNVASKAETACERCGDETFTVSRRLCGNCTPEPLGGIVAHGTEPRNSPARTELLEADLEAAAARIAELASLLSEMVERGNHCNWFADHGDFELVDRARAALGKEPRV